MSHAGFYSPVIGRYRSPELSLALLRQTERRELPAHGHRNAYLSFLISGSYLERVGSRQIEPAAPAVVYHPQDFEHRDAYGPGGGEILVVELEPSWLEAWGSPTLARSAPREVGAEGVLRPAWALYRALRSGAAPLPLDVESRVAELVAELLPPSKAPGPGRPPWLDRVVERLRLEYASPPGMSALARESGVHPTHLSRAFRKFVGCSPSAFVQRQRVRHVWRHVTGRDASALADVALDAGFADQSHCTRVFRRLVGEPPGVVRRYLAT